MTFNDNKYLKQNISKKAVLPALRSTVYERNRWRDCKGQTRLDIVNQCDMFCVCLVFCEDFLGNLLEEG